MQRKAGFNSGCKPDLRQGGALILTAMRIRYFSSHAVSEVIFIFSGNCVSGYHKKKKIAKHQQEK